VVADTCVGVLGWVSGVCERVVSWDGIARYRLTWISPSSLSCVLGCRTGICMYGMCAR